MRKDYVEFIYRGVFFAESSPRPADGTQAVPVAGWPEHAVGYRHFHRYEATEQTVNGPVTLRSEAMGHSPWTYRGKTLSLADARARHGAGSVLVRNMENNGWSRVVDVGGNVWPLNDGDMVIEHDYSVAA